MRPGHVKPEVSGRPRNSDTPQSGLELGMKRVSTAQGSERQSSTARESTAQRSETLWNIDEVLVAQVSDTEGITMAEWSLERGVYTGQLDMQDSKSQGIITGVTRSETLDIITTASGSGLLDITTAVSRSDVQDIIPGVSGSEMQDIPTAVPGSEMQDVTTAASGSEIQDITTAICGSEIGDITTAVSGSEIQDITAAVFESEMQDITTAVSGSEIQDATPTKRSKPSDMTTGALVKQGCKKRPELDKVKQEMELCSSQQHQNANKVENMSPVLFEILETDKGNKGKLTDLTYLEGGPWRDIICFTPSYTEIPDEVVVSISSHPVRNTRGIVACTSLSQPFDLDLKVASRDTSGDHTLIVCSQDLTAPTGSCDLSSPAIRSSDTHTLTSGLSASSALAQPVITEASFHRVESLLDQCRPTFLSPDESLQCDATSKHNTANTFTEELISSGAVETSTKKSTNTSTEMPEVKHINPWTFSYQDSITADTIKTSCCMEASARKACEDSKLPLQKSQSHNSKANRATDVTIDAHCSENRSNYRLEVMLSDPSLSYSCTYNTRTEVSWSSVDHVASSGNTINNSSNTLLSDLSGKAFENSHSHGVSYTLNFTSERHDTPNQDFSSSPNRDPNHTPGYGASSLGTGQDRPSRLRAAKFLATVCGIFMACWSPLVLSVLAYYTMGAKFEAISACTTLAVMNSAVNFFIYAGANKDFRLAFRLLLCGR